MLLQIEEPGQNIEEQKEAEIAVGIDLGTTNSLIATTFNDEIIIIADENEKVIHPSILCFQKSGEILCGNPASEAKVGEKIFSIKRLMGKGFDEIRNQNFPFNIFKSSEKTLKIAIANNEFSATELSAEILKYLKNLAENKLKQKISKAVITVPAYFDEPARNATKDAAAIAGLEVLRLISEPTAAAVAYGLDKGVEGIYAIFDLGGGTFDISILKLQKGIFKVIGVSGDANLGGDDFDNSIVNKIISTTNISNLTNQEKQQLKLAAKKAKEELSEQKLTLIKFKEKELSLSGVEFNELITKEVKRMINITSNLLDDLDLSKNEIKGVVLVGGSTRTLLVRELLAKMFGKEKILTDIDPDKVVAIGAAIQAEALTSGSSNLLLDVIPLSLGIETMGGIVEKIIDRNSTIPLSLTKEFTTYIDGQTGIKLHIVQGERELAHDCRSLANFEIKNIPPLKAGVARIRVTFQVDADGLLTVKAEELITGQTQTIEVKSTYNLDQNQIKKILIKSNQTAKEDIKKRLLIEAKVEAQRNILAILAAIKEDGDLLQKSEIEEIENQIHKLQKEIELNDYIKIVKESEILEDLIKDFAGRKMDKYIGQNLSGKKIDDLD